LQADGGIVRMGDEPSVTNAVRYFKNEPRARRRFDAVNMVAGESEKDI
jgi:hypothetical protein